MIELITMLPLLGAPNIEKSPIYEYQIQTVVTETTETPKIVTWQDNPNQCDQTTQYIALESPYYCIPKPTPKPTQRRSDSTFQAHASNALLQ